MMTCPIFSINHRPFDIETCCTYTLYTYTVNVKYYTQKPKEQGKKNTQQNRMPEALLQISGSFLFY